MNRNFYIYKNKINSENIEDGLEVNSLIKNIDNFIIKQKVSKLKIPLEHPATSGKVLEAGIRTINTARGKGPGLKTPKPETVENVARDYIEEEAQIASGKPSKTGNEALNS